MSNPYAAPKPPPRLVEQTRLLAFVAPIVVLSFSALALKTTRLGLGPAITPVILGVEIAIYTAALSCGVVALRRVRRVGPIGLGAGE